MCSLFCVVRHDWNCAGARNAPLRIGNVKYMSGAMWASPPTSGYSRGIFDIGRTPKGRPYGNCFTVAVLEFAGARNAPLQKFSVSIMSPENMRVRMSYLTGRCGHRPLQHGIPAVYLILNGRPKGAPTKCSGGVIETARAKWRGRTECAPTEMFRRRD